MKHYRNPEWNPKESPNDNLILLCIPNETLKTLGASQRNLKALKNPDKKPLHETETLYKTLNETLNGTLKKPWMKP